MWDLENDPIAVAGATLVNYFPGIPEILAAAGNRVFIPALTPTGGVADRAKQLKDYIVQHSPGEPVHIIAHSMGGLDARYMISCLDMEAKESEMSPSFLVLLGGAFMAAMPCLRV